MGQEGTEDAFAPEIAVTFLTCLAGVGIDGPLTLGRLAGYADAVLWEDGGIFIEIAVTFLAVGAVGTDPAGLTKAILAAVGSHVVVHAPRGHAPVATFIVLALVAIFSACLA